MTRRERDCWGSHLAPSGCSLALPSPPQDVIQVSKKYLPSMAVGYSSPKLTLHVGDGFEFMKQNQDAFDVIITDSSDPMGKQRVGPRPSSSCHSGSQPPPPALLPRPKSEWRTERGPRTSARLSRVRGPGHRPRLAGGLGPRRPRCPLQPPLCPRQASVQAEVGAPSKPRPWVETAPCSASESPPGPGVVQPPQTLGQRIPMPSSWLVF